MKRKAISLFLSLFLMAGATSCLKTRAMLRGDDTDDEDTTPKVQKAQVEDVEPQAYEVDEIKNEITRLTGRIEDLERAQQNQDKKPNAVTQEQLKKLEDRIVELEQAQADMLENIKKMQETASASGDPVDVFEKGKKQFASKDYEKAIDSLSSYMKHTKGKHIQEATFLRAESYYATKQYKKAIIDYSKFPEKYSTSKHMPQALLKIGAAFDALGMRDDAKGFYQELVDKFPKTAEAKQAKRKLR